MRPQLPDFHRNLVIDTSNAQHLVFEGLNVLIAAGTEHNSCFGALFNPLPDRVLKCLSGWLHDVVLFVFHILNPNAPNNRPNSPNNSDVIRGIRSSIRGICIVLWAFVLHS